MFYVYLLQSDDYPDQRYVGQTTDLKQRFAEHNAGKSPHTSKFRPWRLVTYVAFSDQAKGNGFRTPSQVRVRSRLCPKTLVVNKTIHLLQFNLRLGDPPAWTRRVPASLREISRGRAGRSGGTRRGARRAPRVRRSAPIAPTCTTTARTAAPPAAPAASTGRATTGTDPCPACGDRRRPEAGRAAR